MRRGSRYRWFLPAASAGVVLIVLSRLPIIFGGNLAPDGDEAIVGIMAMHLLRGKDFPLFFYGQRYGFSLIETANAATAFALFGISGSVLKLSALFLWCIGWVIWLAALRLLFSRRVAAIAALALAFAPAWADWALKARGIYVSGFLVTNATILLIGWCHQCGRRPDVFLVTIGAFMSLLGFIQPVWLAAAAPFLLLLRHSDRRTILREVGMFGIGFILATTVLLLASISRTTNYNPPIFSTSIDTPLAACLLPQRVWTNLTGWYYLSNAYQPPLSVGVCAAIWLCMVLYAVARALKNSAQIAERIPGFAVLLVMALTLTMNHRLFGYRYLLPVSQMAAVPAALLADRWLSAGGLRRKLVAAGLIVVTVTGAVAIRAFRNPPQAQAPGDVFHPAPRQLAALVRLLLENGNHFAFVTDSALQWQLNLASKGRIVARWERAYDRYWPFVQQTEEALVSGRKVAVISTLPDLEAKVGAYGGSKPVEVMDFYSVVLNAPESLVRGMSFEKPGAALTVGD